MRARGSYARACTTAPLCFTEGGTGGGMKFEVSREKSALFRRVLEVKRSLHFQEKNCSPEKVTNGNDVRSGPPIEARLLKLEI